MIYYLISLMFILRSVIYDLWFMIYDQFMKYDWLSPQSGILFQIPMLSCRDSFPASVMSKMNHKSFPCKPAEGENDIVCKQPTVIMQSWNVKQACSEASLINSLFCVSCGMWDWMTSIVIQNGFSWTWSCRFQMNSQECSRCRVLEIKRDGHWSLDLNKSDWKSQSL